MAKQHTIIQKYSTFIVTRNILLVQLVYRLLLQIYGPPNFIY